MQLRPTTFADLGPAKRDVLRWLGAACRRPGCDLSVIDLIRLCVRGRGQLILIIDGDAPVAAGVTQVREHGDGRRACWVLAVGGTRAWAWRHTLAAIEAGAARLGCATVVFVGRRGWSRLFPDYAATPCPAGIAYTKPIGAP